MLPYAVRKRRSTGFMRHVKGVDVLYEQMIMHNGKARRVLQAMQLAIKDDPKANFTLVKDLFSKMRQCADIAIDCAAKIAPYQSPKLETLEVKSKVEHKFVIEAPQPVASVAEWAKITGANIAKVEKSNAERPKPQPVKPSIHDFTDNPDYNEPGMIN